MHRGSKRDLCRACWLELKPQIQESWREVKARRAAKRAALLGGETTEAVSEVTVELTNGHVDMPTPLLDTLEAFEDGDIDTPPRITSTIVPEPEPQEVPDMTESAAPEVLLPAKLERGERTRVEGGGQFAERLNDEQKREIIRLYCETDEPMQEIQRAYGVSNSYIYSLLGKFNIQYRRYNVPVAANGADIEAVLHPERQLPPQIQAMADANRPAPKPAVVTAAPSAEPELQPGARAWDVEIVISTTVRVYASNYVDAASAARQQHPDAEVIGMRRL